MKALIFDMDGLLVDSEAVWHLAEIDLLAARGFEYADGIREQLIGLRVDDFMVKLYQFFPFREAPEELTQEIIQRMLDLIPKKVEAKPGAAEILAYAVEHRIPRAIASSSPMSIIDAIVASQGWDDIFTVRCSAENEKHGKPAPDVFLRAAEKLGVVPQNCIALEDSPTGARAAAAAEMLCYAVPDGNHTNAAAFADITPHVFESLHDALTQIRTNRNLR